MEHPNRISHYYTVVDDCRLAVDIYFPASVLIENGRVVRYEDKMPVIIKGGYDPRRSAYEFEEYAVDRFTEAGFAVAIVEQRGVGASYGSNQGFFTRLDAKDMVCIIDMLAKEDWCSGKAGMYGGSNKGMIQHLTMVEYAKAHPDMTAEEDGWHLKAAIPTDANTNFYYQNFPNGASCVPVGSRKAPEPALGVPVDEDVAPDYPMARQAMEEHIHNGAFLSQYHANMNRDTRNHALGSVPNMEIPAWSDMDDVKYSGIAVYQNNGWYDPGCTGAMLTYKSWGGRLLLGPWQHYELFMGGGDDSDAGYDWAEDYVNFFEEILMNKNHDIMNQPPIRYYMRNANPGENWRWSADLPVDGQANTYFYMDAVSNRDGSGHGLMGERLPAEGKLQYTHFNVNINGVTGRIERKIRDDMSESDACAITFTGPVLEGKVELVGAPVVSLHVTSTFRDGNFIAMLEEVTSDGVSHLITDGCIRASHAQIHPQESWDALGLPYHRGMNEDLVELSTEEPLELTFNMEATAYTLQKGSRLRVAIVTGMGGYHEPDGFPEEAPVITLYTGKEYPSYIRVPVIKPSANGFIGIWSSQEYSGVAEVYAFNRGIYVNYHEQQCDTELQRSKNRGSWLFYPTEQVYEENGWLLYITKEFTAQKKDNRLWIDTAEYAFEGVGRTPDTVALWEDSEYLGKILPVLMRRYSTGRVKRSADFKDVKVANVPVRQGIRGIMNPQPYHNMNLLMDILLPHACVSDEDWEAMSAQEKEKLQEGKTYPCIVYIHGFGMDNHARELVIPELLEAGYAIVSVDYRTYPPNIWPVPVHDVKGAIRFAKANAERFHLDRERFGVLGSSCGGHLSAMVAATNGAPDMEGNIGGNMDEDSSVKAAAVYFPWTDAFSFGEENRVKYPGEPMRVNLSDGPNAPIGCMIGFSGPGKGMGELKRHRLDKNPYFRDLWERAIEASPISHVTEKSAPCVFVHGNHECGVQIPMAQSIDMFEALTREGVKSLVFLNNGCVYGEDPEVKDAVVAFLKARI